jgi:hypothetical protein
MKMHTVSTMAAACLGTDTGAKHRDAVFERIEGADHGMNRVGQSPPKD